MRRLAALVIAFLVPPTLAGAATTCYVDPLCSPAGNGTGGYTITCDATANGNPAADIPTCIAAVSGADDIINIRGIHSSHDGNCPGDTEGRYFTDQITISGKNGTSGHPIIIQPNGYTSPGTGETVYIDGTQPPTNGWTQCTDCSAGSAQTRCRNVPGTCGDAWFAIEPNSGVAQMALGAQKKDGTPTYRVPDPIQCTGSGVPRACCTGSGTGCGLADLTNAHAGYAGTSPEIDSTSEQTRNSGSNGCTAAGVPATCCTGNGTGNCQWVTVKWGAQTPGNAVGNRSYIYTDNNGIGFAISTSSYITIRGLNVRAFRRHSFDLNAGTGVTITDNHITYNIDKFGNGSDYGVAIYSTNGATVSNNEMGWCGSEGVHEQGIPAGVSANTISNNWIHDLGQINVLGQGASGTPSGMILTDDGTGALSDYTGSVTSGNLIQNLGDESPSGSPGRGIIMENNAKNMAIRDNVISGTSAEGIKIDPNSTGHGDGFNIFNNLIISNGGGGNGYGIWFAPTGAGSSTVNNLVYNNTVVNGASGSLGLNDLGTVTGNIFRNNIFYTTGSQKQVSWSNAQASNIFEFNLVVTSGATAATWAGAHISGGPDYTCAQLTNIAASDIANCPSPVFLSVSDYHIQSTSPAKDAGTATGMPAARTTDIANQVAQQHGFPIYQDANGIQNAVWDMGIDEFVAAAAGTKRRGLLHVGSRAPMCGLHAAEEEEENVCR